MVMQKFSYPYGHGTQSFELETSRLVKEVEMPAITPMADVPAGILEAVNHPIGCEALAQRIKPGDTVTFICNDPTRVANSFEFMPVLVDELNRLGVPDANMEIVFALGTHRLMTHAEMVTAVGENVAFRLKMYNSDCRKQADFEYFGETSRQTPVWINKHLNHRDHVIMTGTIVYHFFSGYGGGRKAVLPGCAAMETVRHNHSFLMDPNSGLGRTVGNPVYEDQMEGVALWAKGRSTFLFNVILDEHHRFLKIFAGDYVKAHQEACKFVDEVYGVKVPRRADIVLASCGGYPKDINVYQMQKTMDNAVLAVRPGGVVIILAECEEGAGNPVLQETCRRLKTIDAIEADLREHFVIGAHKAYAITRLMRKARFILVTGLDPALAKDLLFEAAVKTVPEALALAEKLTCKEASVTLMPAGSLTVPLLAK